MKPILPQKILVSSQHSYQTLRKNQDKICLNLEINQKVDPTNNDGSHLPKLLKIFKTIKHTRKLKLSNLKVSERSRYLPKTIYFAKRMSKTQILQLSDHNLSRHETKGVFESWPRYAKRIKSFTYHSANADRRSQDRLLLNNLLLRYQPWIRDISIESLYDSYGFLPNYYTRRGSPKGLERLSLVLNNCFQHNRVVASDPKHLKGLKHLEILSDEPLAENFIASIMKPLPSFCPDLQSLSLGFGFPIKSESISIISRIKLFQRLKRLKVRLPAMSLEEVRKIGEGLSQCSPTHLYLNIELKNEPQLVPIIQVIQKQKNLQNLKLKLFINKRLRHFGEMRNLFQAIDGLQHLTNLSIYITSYKFACLYFSFFDSLFPNLFKKPIPLESFKFQLQHFRVKNPSQFIDFLKSLQPMAQNLKKLRIDVGHFKLNNKEGNDVLDFMKNLQNIRSLKLQGIMIPSKMLFVNFIESVTRLKFLRSLAFNDISGKIAQGTLADYLEKILLKGGLERFCCSVSGDLESLLQESFQPLRLKNIQKRNPSLVKAPYIPGFNDISSW